jgi:ABC-2 type transport system permease protein
MELARLFRTLRWVGLAAGYVAFGLLGPLVTRYQEALFRNVGGEIKIEVPPPTPAQAIATFIGNASQIGLVVTIFVAAGSLAFDAHPEWAAFLRTRARPPEILAPKVGINAAASVASFALAAVVAWVTTTVLIDPLPAGAMASGIACWSVYLVFVVSVVALAAGVVRSVIGAAGVTVVVLLALPIVGEVFGSVKPWLPSTLVGSLVELVDGASPASFLRAAAVALVLAAACLLGSARLLARREV